MRKILFFIGILSSCTVFSAQNARYLQYIEDWKQTAVEQQAMYHIPASITLAQGLLESSAGQSELARKTNNHFGIKCGSNWLGGSYYYDDDKKGECFRVYQNAAESYEDHSLFLQRDRYKTLFELDPVDYRRWAHGLKECGYATDPLYAYKLVAIIEEYALDTLVESVKFKVESLKKPSSSEDESETIALVVAANEAGEMWVEPKTVKEAKEDFQADHRKEKVNGTPFVYAREGESYSSMAYQLNIKERTLRKWNDAQGHVLQTNDRVFLRKKAKYVRGERQEIWVQPGESLWSVSQREGVQLKTIYEVNEIPRSVKVFKTRQKIRIGKPQIQ